MIMNFLNINNGAGRRHTSQNTFTNAIHMLLLLITVFASFNFINAQVTRMPARQIASQNPTITAVERQTYLRYGVRWLDVKQRFFGATMNISLADAMATPGWKVSFKFKNPDVGIMEYWGNWQSNMLAQGEYEAYPDNLLPDQDGVYYFSFNGFFGADTVSDETLRGLSLSAAVIYPASGSAIDATKLGSNFYLAPIATDLPKQAFGNFLRSETDNLQRKSATSNRSDTSHLEANDKPVATNPASKVGLYVTVSILGVFVVVVGATTVLSYRSRAKYRKEIASRDSQTRSRHVDTTKLPHIEDDNNGAGGYAPVLTSRPTREQLLTIPTNPNRMSRRIQMQSVDLQSPTPLGHPARFNRQLQDTPETSVIQHHAGAVAAPRSPFSSHQVIEDYAKNHEHSDDLSAILPDDLHQVTVEMNSDRMTVLPRAMNGTATSRRFLTSESYPPPPPELSDICESYHETDDTPRRVVNGR